MSRQRRKLTELSSGPDSPLPSPNRNQPRPSEPLNFHEPIPSTIFGRVFFSIRELFYIARHIFNVLIFGVGYDLTPVERERASRLQEARTAAQRQQAQQQGDMALLGRIRNTFELEWQPGSPTVTLCGDVVAGEQDSFAHAITAYTHLDLDPSVATAKHSTPRIIRYTGPSNLTILPTYTPYNFPTFEYAPYGSLQAFLLTTPSYPSLNHPAIPNSAANSALPLHWLLNLASAISFLHSHGVAHRALALNLLWLRADFSTALFDLTCSVYTTHDDEWDEDVPVQGDLPSWGSFPFPVDDVELVYYSGATAEDAMAFGKAMDVFEFGTVAWRVLSRTAEGAPGWVMPKRKEGERTWTLTELQQRLREAMEAVGTGMGKAQYEPPGMELVRKCWALEYRDGNEVLEALRRVVLETGLKVQHSDEVEGVAQAVEEFKKNYKPKSYLGDEVFSEHGYA